MVLGIDLSMTATGIAGNDSGEVWMKTIPSKPGQIEDRLMGIVKQVNAIISEHQPTCVVIEGLAMASSTGSSHERSFLHFAVRASLRMRRIPFYICAPSSLKKFVSGGGKCEKSMIIREVYRNWNVVAADDNQADAAGLSFVAAAIEGTYKPTNQAQREVVAKVLEPAKPKAKRKGKE